MSVFSPTAAGFKLIFRRSAIPLAEIAWRWSIAAAVWLLCAGLFAEYADTLPVNKVDRLLLGSQQPALVVRALHRIFHGSALRFTESAILLGIALTIAWIVVAALGRAATLKAIAEEFDLAAPGSRVASLSGLNFLRAATTLAAIVGVMGAAFIASGIWASTHLSAADAARLWVGLLFLVWLAWSVLNWFLTSSAIFVVADGSGSFPALASAVGWFRESYGSIIATGIWFGLVHGGMFTVAYGAGFSVLSMSDTLGTAPTIILEFLIIAGYCVVADFLYIGRLTAYLVIARGEDLVLSNWQPQSFDGRSGSSAVDQSELILSDVPLPAM
ncbi:MAG TPA: hypothetical protein VH596_05550 [Terriglobales bacterium]|jgi:hypothetical protein